MPRLGPLTDTYERLLGEITSRYQSVSIREQRLIVATAVILPVSLFIFGLWLPIKDELKALQLEAQQLEIQVQEAGILADAVLQKADASAGGKSLINVVESAASQSKVRSYINRIKPQSGIEGRSRLLVSMRKAPFNDFTYFMSRLADQNTALNMLKLRPATAPGLVDVELLILGQ